MMLLPWLSYHKPDRARHRRARKDAAATIEGSIASIGKNLTSSRCRQLLVRMAPRSPGSRFKRKRRARAQRAGNRGDGHSAPNWESPSARSRNERPEHSDYTFAGGSPSLHCVGYAEMAQGHFEPSFLWLERAIALDPNFAMAYGTSRCRFPKRRRHRGASANTIDKAFALIDRVSAYERYWIATHYYSFNGELDKAIDAYRLAMPGLSPLVDLFRNNLSESLISPRAVRRGAEGGSGSRSARAACGISSHRRLLDAYICLDRLGQAKEVAQKGSASAGNRRSQESASASSKWPTSRGGGDCTSSRETQWYVAKPEEYLSFGLQAAYRFRPGPCVVSRASCTSEPAQIALRPRALGMSRPKTLGRGRGMRAQTRCRAPPRTVRRLGRPALALAMCGDAAQAEPFSPRRHRMLFPKRYHLEWAVQLPGQPAPRSVSRAISRQKPWNCRPSASPYERAYPEAAYLRGLAYLRLKKGAEAATEFRKIVDHKGANWGSTWQHPNWGLYYSISTWGRRGPRFAGDTQKAKKAFQDFFALWKDADSDIPILKQAKAEYAKLRSSLIPR